MNQVEKRVAKILKGADLEYAITKKEGGFDRKYTNESNSQVKSIIRDGRRSEKKPLIIKYYWNPFGIALAKVKNNDGIIRINKAKIKNSASLAGTIAHEYCHVLGYTHGDNYKYGKNGDEDKSNSVPWWIGSEVKRIYNVYYPVQKRRSWLRRMMFWK